MANDISTLIAAIQSARNTIRTKLQELGLVTSTAKLADCATAIDAMENRGAVQAIVKEGETYAIPKGWHNGSGTVSGAPGGGNYSLQSKSVTPTKNQQNVTPESGYYGLSDVTVLPIPEQYQDTSPVTATAPDVLANKIIVTADGKVVAGTMVNNGDVERTLDTVNTSFTIPQGYHSGYGKIGVITETKSATPTKSAQTISATEGKVLSSVAVEPIPDIYVDTREADAIAAEILKDKIVFVDGEKVVGTMPDNGAVDLKIDGMSTTSVAIPIGYHNGSGTVSLTNDIEEALAAI